MIKKILTGVVLVATPLTLLAQGFVNQDTSGRGISGILGTIATILGFIVPIIVTLAVIYFFYGVVRYVIANDADAKQDAKQVVIRGILGLFIMLSVWGLIGILQSTFGVGVGGGLDSSNIPSVNFDRY